MRPTIWGIMSNFEKMQFYLSVGFNTGEIAEMLRHHPGTISRWKGELKTEYIAFEKELEERTQ